MRNEVSTSLAVEIRKARESYLRAWQRYRDEKSSEAERDVKRAEELYDGLTRRLEHLRAS